MADFTEIIQEINTNLSDNNTQAITAAKLRTTLIDLTNTIETNQDDFETNFTTNAIVDSLSSTDTDKALSANQGRVLSETLGLNFDIDFVNQGIIQNNGTITSSTYYKYSDPIFIKNGCTVNVLSRGSGFGVISTCNQDGTNIQVVVGSVTSSPNDYVLYTYTATADCYVRVCGQFYFDDYPAKAYYFFDTDFLKDKDIDDVLNVSKTDKLVSNSRIAELNNELQEINEALRRTDVEFSNIGIIRYKDTGGNPDGTIGTNQYYKYSDPIFIKNGWTINVLSKGNKFGAINTCNQDGTNIQVVVGVNFPTNPTVREAFTWTAPNDCYVIVCGQFYTEGQYAEAWYIGDIQRNNNSNNNNIMEEKTFTAELTMAYTTGNGGIYQSNTTENIEANARKCVATIYWIEVGSFKQDETIQCTPYTAINEGETYKVFFYNADYSVISNSTLTLDGEYSATIPTGTKFIRLFLTSTNDLNYSVRYVEIKLTTNLLRWHGVRNFLTTPDYIKPVGSDTPYGTTLKYYRIIFEVPYNGERLWNLGWFFYSPFYKPVGKKTKLAILYCGSNGYKFNQPWGPINPNDPATFTDNYHSIVYSLVHSGYNVALCACEASIYANNDYRDYSGDQVSINAYQAYYDYLIKNFNIEKEPYIIGYSNGGMPAGRTNILGDIPAKAIAGGAIVTELVELLRIMAANGSIQKYANRLIHNCGVDSSINLSYVNPGAYNSALSTNDFNILKDQGDILKNYSPMFMSCDGLDWDTYIDTMKGVQFTSMENNTDMIALMENVKIQSKVPIKIWIARDDENVSYGIEKFYVEAVNRGGGRAFLRTMPDGTGKHGMGNYGNENSIKVLNYKFKDGTVGDTTLFMTEVINWFEQWK